MGFRIPRPETAFTLDPAKKRRDRNQKEPDHLGFIRGLPCAVCGTRNGIEAAHVRFASPAHGKAGTAMAQKPDDRWTVPLCRGHHREGANAQHNANERQWWNMQRIDPCGLALALYTATGDEEAAARIIAANRQAKR